MDKPDQTYPGGAAALIALWQERRAPLGSQPGEGLPELSVDLAALASARISEAPPAPRPPTSGFQLKWHGLATELVGHSELAVLNGLVIAHLRKRSYPEQAPALFRRIWAEQGAALLADLPMRWLISSAITFADHGPTETDRKVGQSLNLLFSLMKLYEFERQFSGVPPEEPHRLGKRLKAPLPMGMPEFALASGGLDINLLAPIWHEALAAPAIGPLACHLLEALNRDPATLFRRLNQMRETRRARMAAKDNGN